MDTVLEILFIVCILICLLFLLFNWIWMFRICCKLFGYPRMFLKERYSTLRICLLIANLIFACYCYSYFHESFNEMIAEYKTNVINPYSDQTNKDDAEKGIWELMFLFPAQPGIVIANLSLIIFFLIQLIFVFVLPLFLFTLGTVILLIIYLILCHMRNRLYSCPDSKVGQ